MTTLLLLIVAATLLVVLGWWTSVALRHQDRTLEATRQLVGEQQITKLAVLETNRLIARLIELEDQKQQQRQSGRELLRERIQARVAQMAQARAK